MTATASKAPMTTKATRVNKTPMKLKDRMEASEASPAAPAAPMAVSSRAPARTQASTTAQARVGKKATVGHFSEAMSRQLNMIAASEGRTLQSCMGEAWDLWLKSKGYEPFGES